MPREGWFLSTNDIPLHRSKSITFWACLNIRKNASCINNLYVVFQFAPVNIGFVTRTPASWPRNSRVNSISQSKFPRFFGNRRISVESKKNRPSSPKAGAWPSSSAPKKSCKTYQSDDRFPFFE